MTTPDGEQPWARPAPLAGVVVADFSRVLAGPLASMFLADLGATVIKVERPVAGDDTRSWGPPYVDDSGMSTYFTSVNRNKRSITLDLDDGDDLALAHRLADRADVFIENFRPGRLAAFGLDQASLAGRHPGVVYCSISGFGSGTGADLPGYDFVVQAVGGLMSITGHDPAEPTKVGVALVDVLTGLHATIAILAALRERDRADRGQHVEVNLLSSLLGSLVNQGSGYINGAAVPVAMGNRHPSIAPYETLTTKQGPLAVAIGNNGQFAAFTEAIGHAALSRDARFTTNDARVRNRDELADQLESALSAKSAVEWTALLQGKGIACGPINSIDQAIAYAESLQLRPVINFDAAPASAGDQRYPKIATLANPLTLHKTPVQYRRRPPTLGADTDEVKAWLLTDERTPLQA